MRQQCVRLAIMRQSLDVLRQIWRSRWGALSLSGSVKQPSEPACHQVGAGLLPRCRTANRAGGGRLGDLEPFSDRPGSREPQEDQRSDQRGHYPENNGDSKAQRVVHGRTTRRERPSLCHFRWLTATPARPALPRSDTRWACGSCASRLRPLIDRSTTALLVQRVADHSQSRSSAKRFGTNWWP